MATIPSTKYNTEKKHAKVEYNNKTLYLLIWAVANYIRVVGLYDSTIMDATQVKKKRNL